MQITLNGEAREVTDGITVSDLIEQAGLKSGRKGIAVAVNAAVVVRSAWETARLSPDDRVDLIHVVQGG